MQRRSIPATTIEHQLLIAGLPVSTRSLSFFRRASNDKRKVFYNKSLAMPSTESATWSQHFAVSMQIKYSISSPVYYISYSISYIQNDLHLRFDSQTICNPLHIDSSQCTFSRDEFVEHTQFDVQRAVSICYHLIHFMELVNSSSIRRLAGKDKDTNELRTTAESAYLKVTFGRPLSFFFSCFSVRF